MYDFCRIFLFSGKDPKHLIYKVPVCSDNHFTDQRPDMPWETIKLNDGEWVSSLSPTYSWSFSYLRKQNSWYRVRQDSGMNVDIYINLEKIWDLENGKWPGTNWWSWSSNLGGLQSHRWVIYSSPCFVLLAAFHQIPHSYTGTKKRLGWPSRKADYPERIYSLQQNTPTSIKFPQIFLPR